ncbi:MAG TPA: HAD family hydrolase [Candidatus Limnocylindria bacterium]|nr:HAD family hydrolase [Candidatus Limnocylindria bacterium]
MTIDRWVCLDVGETLIDETRIWSAWADELGIPRLTLHAALGATIARGEQHGDVFSMFGIDDWRDRVPRVERAYGGFRVDDLYPDALPTLAALRARGCRVAVVANQPAARTAELRAIGVEAEVIAMSDELGVAKPDPAFFARALELMGDPAPGNVAYVGDRIDNDVSPAIAAGMRAVWLRRGPWGVIGELPDDVVPALVVDSLTGLVDRIDEVWSGN